MENRNSVQVNSSTAKIDQFKANKSKDTLHINVHKKIAPSVLPFISGMKKNDVHIIRKLLGGIHTYNQSFCGE
jgi:hypothetical protein